MIYDVISVRIIAYYIAIMILVLIFIVSPYCIRTICVYIYICIEWASALVPPTPPIWGVL